MESTYGPVSNLLTKCLDDLRVEWPLDQLG